MINSPAFKNLTNASRVAYLLLKAQVREAKQKEVIFPYSDAAKFMNRNTFKKSFEQLEKFGFIERTRGCLQHIPNQYRFIEQWRNVKDVEETEKNRPLMARYRRGINFVPAKEQIMAKIGIKIVPPTPKSGQNDTVSSTKMILQSDKNDTEE